MDDLSWCISYLAKVNGIKEIPAPSFASFRALMNITLPEGLSEEYYLREGRILEEALSHKEVVDVSSFPEGISLFQGDITLLKADAIVNACNAKMLGCFVPGHHCIDNAIHSFAGLELRRDMMEIMAKQGHDEPNGQVKVTEGYHLPARYVFHTVGPIYSMSKQNETDLRNCYLSCLNKAEEMGLESLVFCSLSTGIYGYPISKASDVAIHTVKEFLSGGEHRLKRVVFDLFSDADFEVYRRKLK